MPGIEPKELFYWAREVKSSQAEIDYVVQIDGKIIPIEVKSGKTGRLKSLQIFLQEKNIPMGVKVSQEPLGKSGNVLSLPLYMVGELKRLVEIYC